MSPKKGTEKKGKPHHRKHPSTPPKQKRMMSKFHVNDSANKDVDQASPADQGNDLEALAEQQHARALERYNYCVEHEIWSGMLEILQTKPESHECATLLLQNMYATANWYGKEFPEEEEFVEQQVRDAVARAELRASEENERARASHHRGQSMPSNTSVRDMAMMFSTHQEDGSEGVRMT